MTLVGIPLADQAAIFAASASVLHLGNINFTEGEEDSSHVTGKDAEFHLNAAASLLGVEAKGLAKALTTRTRQTPDGTCPADEYIKLEALSFWAKKWLLELGLRA